MTLADKNFNFLGVRRLILYLIERYCPFNISVFQILAALVTTALLGAVLVLSWMSFKKVREVVTVDFNQQQLVLAQHAATQIENSLNILKKELSILSLSPSIQYFEKVSIGKRMEITYSSIKETGALEIRYVEAGRFQTHLIDNNGYQTIKPYPECLEYIDWAKQPGNKGKILISEVLPVIYGDINGSHYQKLIMRMVTPVWQVSVDETNPVATNRFSGALIFIVDATTLIEKITKSIRSGKTGYAWVIDGKGTFLYHPEREFIGKNAFEARKEKKPTISFARINEIQKSMMLAGKEGASWYISGWHRGKQGEMKKLIAYTPIHTAEPASRLWSVAVVAPTSEVEDAIHSIHVRQFWLQTIIIVVILLGGTMVISLMVNWSRTLESEVAKKTLEITRSELQYKALVENADDVIFTVSIEGTVLSMNEYGYQFFTKKTEDILGHGVTELFNNGNGCQMLGIIREVFDSNTSRQLTCSTSLNGSEYWLGINFSGLLDEWGNVYKVLGIGRNITERKKIEEQMFYTEKLASLGTLASGVAHEINNPLAIILGFTDMLLEKTPQDSEQYDILKTVEKQGLNAKRVVENLLSFARYREHKEEEIDLNKNIEEVLAVAGNTLSVKKITVKKDFEVGIPRIKGDPREYHQVFLNLINNAVDSMKNGGVLKIMTRVIDSGRQVMASIADTGSGINKEYRMKIFDPLFTTKEVGKGTGLGLSVSYGIIKKYGGEITFKTKTAEESKETGTTFFVRLPAVQTNGG